MKAILTSQPVLKSAILCVGMLILFWAIPLTYELSIPLVIAITPKHLELIDRMERGNNASYF